MPKSRVGTRTSPTSAQLDRFRQGLKRLQAFLGDGITPRIAAVEVALQNTTIEEIDAALATSGATPELLEAAAAVKRIAGQVNVAIHAIGILLCLPHILEPKEVVEYVSLGAGNTGKPFDLETSLRVAEFKFIHWKGGAESIRQNGIFRDFFKLCEHQTTKEKYLYVLGSKYPLAFLSGKRSLSSVLKDANFRQAFLDKHGTNYRVVRDYFQTHSEVVKIVDVSDYLPELTHVALGE